eukprot:CFRG6300T1
MTVMDLKLIAGTSHRKFCDKIAYILRKRLCGVEIESRSNDEKCVGILESVRESNIFIIQTGTSNVNDMLMELMFMISVCKSKSAARVCAVIPHFPYARENVSSEIVRYPNVAKVVANMLASAGADRIVTMDLHANQIQGCFDIPVDNLVAEPMIKQYILDNHNTDNLVIVSPDAGGAKRSASLAELLNCGVALIHKERIHKEGTDGLTLVGDVQGKIAIILDDMADTCSTIVKAAGALRGAGAEKVHAICIHGLLSQSGIKHVMESCIETLVVTNTIPVAQHQAACPKLRTIDVSAVFAEAIRRVNNGESISYLFHHVPLPILPLV